MCANVCVGTWNISYEKAIVVGAVSHNHNIWLTMRGLVSPLPLQQIWISLFRILPITDITCTLWRKRKVIETVVQKGNLSNSVTSFQLSVTHLTRDPCAPAEIKPLGRDVGVVPETTARERYLSTPGSRSTSACLPTPTVTLIHPSWRLGLSRKLTFSFYQVEMVIQICIWMRDTRRLVEIENPLLPRKK